MKTKKTPIQRSNSNQSMTTLRRIWNTLQTWVFGPVWHLIYPRQCSMCGRVLLINEQHICPECLLQLPKTEEAWHRDNRVECIFSDMPKFVRGAAYCFYLKAHPFRNAIRAMKFNSQPEIGQWLGQMAAEEWKDSTFFDGIDYIIPIPLHKKRLRERGYNQAEWIAQGISQVTGIPIDTKHLLRQTNNSHQSRMDIEERRKLGHVFTVKNPDEIRGKHVLLIDDVITSGTTMRRAMEALQPIRNCHYSVFALAIAHY